MAFLPRWERKMNQEQELAALARIDGDYEDMKKHLKKAEEYRQLAVEERQNK